MTDEQTISGLEPEFAERVRQFKLDLLKDTGWEWFVVQGRRTIAYQNELYSKGRTTPGKIVTNARGGQSPHNFGLAVDMVPVQGGELWWNAQDILFRQYADLAVEKGFIAGYYFHSLHDADHIEDKDWKVMQALWKDGKIDIA